MTAELDAQPVGVPDGWVMVPELPDARMLDAAIGVYAFADELTIDVVWRAMLAAAPQPTAQPSADVEDAKRYRWLRANAVRGRMESCGRHHAFALNCDEPESEWDATIDAARAAEGEGNGQVND